MTGKTRKALGDFFHIIGYCMELSLKASRFYTAVRILNRLFFSLVSILYTYLASRLMGYLVGSVGGEDVWLSVLGLFGFIIAVKISIVLYSEVNEYCAQAHNDLMNNYLNNYTIEKSYKIDIEYYDSPGFYDAMTSVKRDNYAFASILWYVIDSMGMLVSFLGIFLVLGRQRIWFAVAVLATILPSAVINQYFTKYIYEWDLKNIGEQRQMGYIQSILSARRFAMDIRLFDVGGFLQQKYQTAWRLFFDKRRKMLKKRTFYVAVFSALPDLCEVAIMLFLTYEILGGRATVAEYTLYTGLVGQLSGSIMGLVRSCNSIYENRLRIENVRNFENYQNHVRNDGKRTVEGDVAVAFKDVWFRYPGADKYVLSGVSFEIGAKEKVCIVGLNGAGKSTIIKLLLRFYDVSQGEILINGVDIKEYELSGLRKHFNAFFQDVNHYSFTLRENVKMSDLEHEDREDRKVWDSLGKSDALEMVGRMPEGLDQYITKGFAEGGIELSGGQYQKLALARMFYRESDVVLLDEPSAALDPEAEYRLFQVLEGYAEGRTTIYTSHRLSNVHLADRIILIEAGTVREKGTHEELIWLDGRYAQLYQYQAEKFHAGGTGE